MFLNPSLLVRAANTTFNAAAESSPMPQCNDIHHCRTLQSIIYGSFSTIFLCTWTAFHFNLPYPPWWKRVGWMMVALFAPEIVFVQAFFDWTKSSDLLREILEKYPECGWTETHTQFVRMGGFRLEHANKKTFLDCIRDGTIDLPELSKDDILARSKGSFIAKCLAVIQTAWFVTQCIHRHSQHLLLTELEITTLAHTLVNFFIYFFWWHKPYGVAVPIIVPGTIARGWDESGIKILSVLGGRDDNGMAPQHSWYIRLGIKILKQVKLSILGGRDDNGKPQHSWYTRLGIKIHTVLKEAELSMLGLIVLSIVYFIVGGAFGAMHCLAWNSAFPTRAEQYIWRVSSLIVTVIGGTTLLSIWMITGLIFNYIRRITGIFNCFRRRNERRSHAWGRSQVRNSFLPKIWFEYKIIGSIPFLIYCVARVSLLVLALLQLRALPYAGYVTPSWTIFYPHIG
ncbi:hypothetical protein M378DRAFT_25598 [Amanita muscaria Koide BX008]|uniref:Uncharacterized protein n=1 Tax=Amanita muscaria (strain Koide BX008) TaxID=946122 RepID=A0A0C2SGY4_AMAMK|nr:hypothetical protein M378DRAFT_25598 [Amanita muscaria Koide BX008]